MLFSKPILASFCHLEKKRIARRFPLRFLRHRDKTTQFFRLSAIFKTARQNSRSAIPRSRPHSCNPAAMTEFHRRESPLIPPPTVHRPLPTREVTKRTKPSEFCHSHRTETPRFLDANNRSRRQNPTISPRHVGPPETLTKLRVHAASSRAATP